MPAAGRQSRSSRPQVQARIRESQALQLRRAGVSVLGIAKQLKISRTSAHSAIIRGLKRVAAEMAEEAPYVLPLELGRLDRLFAAVLPVAIGDPKSGVAPDLAAVDRAVNIIRLRCQLQGVEAAPFVEQHFNVFQPGGGNVINVALGEGGAFTDEDRAAIARVLDHGGALEQLLLGADSPSNGASNGHGEVIDVPDNSGNGSNGSH